MSWTGPASITTSRVLLTLQDGPPLPPSLAVLRLLSVRVELGELARGEERLSIATGPTLAARAEVIRCSLECIGGGAEPRAARSAATPRRAVR